MLTQRTTNRMGWRPDLPDFRDWSYRSLLRGEAGSSQPLPVRTYVPKIEKQPVFDQGYLGSCVGNAVALIHAFERGVAPRSRLQIYYEARRLIGETEIDAGAYIRDGIKVVSQLGAGREIWWPYIEERFDVDPLENVDRDALLRRIFSYTRLMTRNDFRHCLSTGHPFVIGFTVYNSFMTERVAASGIATLPLPGDYPIGGHAIAVIGYDSEFRDTEQASRLVLAGYPQTMIPEDVYICRNSWGVGWGANGNFYIDAKYLENPGLAGDAWTVRKAAENPK